MIPYLVIGIAALIGLVGWGLPGALLGGFLAWAANMLIGAVAWLVDRGAIPRKIREQTATEFLDIYRVMAAEVYPGLSRTAMQKAIESEIERIARTAMEEAAAWQTGLEHDLLKTAADKLVQQEAVPLRRELINSLAMYLERRWYQGGQA
ncbi:MAG: hypothetical protein FJ245_10190 [Nitrospira sp.]|nr:hypothetical protein [Nitrospira sp.]